jgi:hypothetical protein
MPQAIPVQEAAAEIVRLINASPRSPRQEEIEAILAKAVPSGTAPATPLLTKIRKTAARLDEAFDALGKVKPGDPVEAGAQARIDQLEGDLEDLEGQIPNPSQSLADLLAWAEIARAGADIRKDGTMAETTERDVFTRPAARLIEAVLQFAKLQAAR